MDTEVKSKRARGTGCVFRKGSQVWWIKFYDRGIPRRESSRSVNLKDAEKLLKRRLAEVTTDTYVVRQNIRIDELVDDLMGEYREKARKSIDHTKARWDNHLKSFFTKRRAQDVTTDHVRRYIHSRQAQGAMSATINRELAFLKRAFNLGLECTPPKVKIVPYIPMLKESNARRGFLESDAYLRLAEECGAVGLWLRSIFECAHTYGWRHGELLSLRVQQVDLLAAIIRLDPGTTKNGQGREVSMTRVVRELLTLCVHGKRPEDFVFTRENGRKVLIFRSAWRMVCSRAGVGELLCPVCKEAVDQDSHCTHCDRDYPHCRLRYRGLIFHDLRRTAVRNMVRAGIPERVAMAISGHKTRAIFDRYHIVAPNDLAEASRKLDALAEQNADGHRMVPLAPKEEQNHNSQGSDVVTNVRPN